MAVEYITLEEDWPGDLLLLSSTPQRWRATGELPHVATSIIIQLLSHPYLHDTAAKITPAVSALLRALAGIYLPYSVVVLEKKQ